jgi:hypothetical protein
MLLSILRRFCRMLAYFVARAGNGLERLTRWKRMLGTLWVCFLLGEVRC